MEVLPSTGKSSNSSSSSSAAADGAVVDPSFDAVVRSAPLLFLSVAALAVEFGLDDAIVGFGFIVCVKVTVLSNEKRLLVAATRERTWSSECECSTIVG